VILLKTANATATEDIEPFLDIGRTFVSDYDYELHNKLSLASEYFRVDENLFWHHSFLAVSPAHYESYIVASDPTIRILPLILTI